MKKYSAYNSYDLGIDFSGLNYHVKGRSGVRKTGTGYLDVAIQEATRGLKNSRDKIENIKIDLEKDRKSRTNKHSIGFPTGNTNGCIEIPAHTHLKLMGSITLADSTDKNILANANPASYDHDCIIEGGTWNGNKANNASGSGVYWRHATNPSEDPRAVELRDMRIISCEDYGIMVNFTSSPTSRIKLFNITNFLSVRGLYFEEVADMMAEHVWTGATNSAQYGLTIVDGGVHNYVDVKVNNRVLMNNTKRISFVGFMFDESRDSHCVTMQGTHHCVFNGGQIRYTGTDGFDTNAGIYMEDDGGGDPCEYNIFNAIEIGRLGAAATTNRFDYGIEESDSDQDYNLYRAINAYDSVTAPLRILGANSIDESNIGYLIVNGGYSSGSSGVQVTHGLTAVPTNIIVTLSGSTPGYASTALSGSSHFYVYHTGSGAALAYFYWYAET